MIKWLHKESGDIGQAICKEIKGRGNQSITNAMSNLLMMEKQVTTKTN
jgi:hypothetical protein